MTGAPFRDLFVELPRAVFESLQAIGGGAIARAREQTHAAVAPPPRRRASLFEERHIRLVLARYGWRSAGLIRRETVSELQISALLDCGHRQSYRVDEIAILRACNPVDELELLDRVVDRTERICQCVRRAELAA